MVEIKEEWDGWIKIVISNGDKWIFLVEKIEVINEGFIIYVEVFFLLKVMGIYNV